MMMIPVICLAISFTNETAKKKKSEYKDGGVLLIRSSDDAVMRPHVGQQHRKDWLVTSNTLLVLQISYHIRRKHTFDDCYCVLETFREEHSEDCVLLWLCSDNTESGG